MATTPFEIVDFWRSAGSKVWFAKNEAFDASLRERFEGDHHAAARGERDAWAVTAVGALALVLVFDQFPRNIWRRSPHAYATDPLARQAAARAIIAGQDRAIETDLRGFFYLPYEHSEHLGHQELSVTLAEALQSQGGPDASGSRRHRDIIVRFGRFPHRNRCLGRETTPEEAAFLKGGGFSG